MEVAIYKTKVPVFSSGAEAREHGMRDIEKSGNAAMKMIMGLLRKRKKIA